MRIVGRSRATNLALLLTCMATILSRLGDYVHYYFLPGFAHNRTESDGKNQFKREI